MEKRNLDVKLIIDDGARVLRKRKESGRKPFYKESPELKEKSVTDNPRQRQIPKC